MVWINGPFGIGKTTVARELRRVLPRAVILDPERIGFLLQRLTRCQDFRTLSGWEWLTIYSVRLLERFGRNVIVPMCISDIYQMQRIRSALYGATGYGPVVQLVATRETILARIYQRKDGVDWAESHFDEGMELCRYPVFGRVIDAEAKTSKQLAKAIVCEIDLILR